MPKKSLSLIITEDFPFIDGGISVYTRYLAINLADLGENIIVVAPHTDGDLEFDKSQVSIKVIRMHFFKNRWLRLISRIYYTLRVMVNFKINKIYATKWFPCGLVAKILGWIFRTPYFLSTHGTDITYPLNPCRKKMLLSIIHGSRGIFAGSQFTKDWVLKFGISSNRVKFIPYGVDTKIFYPDNTLSASFKERYNFKDKKILLTLARIAWHKGHSMVIRAMPLVLKEFPNTAYIIVGRDHGEKQKLELLIGELGLERYVHFLGYIPRQDLPSVYNACDIFIMVSRVIEDYKDVEGFGIVYAEAGACGKPSIGSRTGGISDAVIDNFTGFLVNPLDVNEIANVIIKLLKDKKLNNYIGRNAYKRSKEDLSWDKLIRQTKEFSDSLM